MRLYFDVVFRKLIAPYLYIIKDRIDIISSALASAIEDINASKSDIQDMNSTSMFTYVYASSDSINNGAELNKAYNDAKLKLPDGNQLSSTNRHTILLSPGTYQFSSNFVIDTQFIDIVSSTGEKYVNFAFTNGSTIYVTANDVYLNGIDVGSTSFRIATNLTMLKCEKCKGGNASFNSLVETVVASGTFIDCEGGTNSFGTWNGVMGFPINGSTTGTFIRCKGGAESFGSRNSCGGLFIDCEGIGNNTFGKNSVITGTFIRCKATGAYSFGQGGSSSSIGVYYHCIGGFNSFASTTNNGFYYHCISGSASFVGVSGASTGKAIYCIANNIPFNFGFTAQNLL